MQISPRFVAPFAPFTGGMPKIASGPITNGLMGVWLPGVYQFNLVDAAFLQLTDTANARFGSGLFGANYNCTSANLSTAFKSLGPTYLAKSPNWTIYGLASLGNTTSTAGAGLYCERAGSGNDIIKVDWTSPVAQLTLRNDAGTIAQPSVGLSNNFGYHSFVGTKFGNGGSSNLILYLDNVTGAANWTGTDSYTDALVPTIGYDFADSSGGWPGPIVIVAVWNRVLSPVEVFQLSSDPFAMLEFPEQMLASTLVGIFVPPPPVINLMPQAWM